MSYRRSAPYPSKGGTGRSPRGSKLSGPQRRPFFRAQLEANMKGFLATCNNSEQACIREALNLLSEYADKLYGKEEKEKDSEPAEPTTSKTDAGDMADELKQEIQSLQNANRNPAAERRFNVVNSRVKNTVFIQTNLPNPVEVVHAVLTDLKATQKPRSRHLLRLLPVEGTCRAYLPDISKLAHIIFDAHFKEGNKTYLILYRCRNNSNVRRESLIDTLGDIIRLKNVSNHANLNNPELTVLVEICQTICCLSVVPDYYTLAKYNVLAVSTCEQAAESKKEKPDEPIAVPEGTDTSISHPG